MTDCKQDDGCRAGRRHERVKEKRGIPRWNGAEKRTTAKGAAVAAVGVAKRNADGAADRVLALVSCHDSIPPALLLHPSRCRAPVARARQLAMYLMHTSLGRTMTEVGCYFGRDRTTVAYACGRIEDKRDDAGFDAEVSALEDRIAVSRGALASMAACHV